MPEPDIFDALSGFFDDMPDAVRTEISLLLTVLAEDRPVEIEGWADCESAARGLFNGQSRAGRIGDLIKAVGIFDVYFAADPRERLGLPRTAGRGNRSAIPQGRYAALLVAIEQAARNWETLRQTTLSAAAIHAALTPAPKRATRESHGRSQSLGTHPTGM